jgi:glycosyltransferase involved in cell wall biosynthesis
MNTATQVVWDNGIQIPDNYFANEYPEVPSERYFKLPYIGVNWSDFKGRSPAVFDEPVITYAGSFYDGWIEPHDFIDGLACFKSMRKSKNIDVRFYGDWKKSYTEYAQNQDVLEWIYSYDWIDYADLVPILMGSNAVLYIGGTNDRNAINIPSKIYDYIGSGTPILAVVDPSFRVAKVIEEYELGIVVHPKDTRSIADAITKLTVGNYEYKPSKQVREKFSRQTKMDALARVLNSVYKGEPYVPR